MTMHIIIGFCHAQLCTSEYAYYYRFFFPITINSWGLVFFAACHDGLNILFDL